MTKPLSLLILTYSAWIIIRSPNSYITGVPCILCALCSLFSSSSSQVWRILSGSVLLFTSFLSLFLISTLQPIFSIPSIALDEVMHLLRLGISLYLLVSYRIPSSSNFMQSVLLYLIAGTSLLSVIYSITQYYIPKTTGWAN